MENNKLLKLIHTVPSILAVCIIIAPAVISKAVLYIACGSILSMIVFYFYDKLQWGRYTKKRYFTIDILIIILLVKDFYDQWLPSSKIAFIADKVGMSVNVFLEIVAVILGIMSLGTIHWIIMKAGSCLEKLFGERQGAYQNICIFAIVMLQYLSLQYSSTQSLEYILHQNLKIIVLNLLIVFTVNMVAVIILQKWRVTLSLTSTFFCFWSIANYYVILFHGSPLYLSELVNVKTATAVMSTYEYNPSVAIVFAVFALIVEFQCIFQFVLDKYTTAWYKNFMTRFLLCSIGIVLSCVMLRETLVKISHWMPWDDIVIDNGFFVSVIDDYVISRNPISEPEGKEQAQDRIVFTYDAKDLEYISKTQDTESSERPDIILILNETFYDPAYFVSLTTDVDYMEDFYSIEGAQYGYAVTPDTGGGTNNSEFELLYSKSMKYLGGAAPFTYLEKQLLQRGVVSYLKKLGYTTTGMHCGEAGNYSRNTAYPEAGFDHVYLGREAFSYLSYNGNRPWTDEDNYKDLISHYENADESPQFFYLLTFQNHGGFSQNEDSLDTVHVNEDFGELTDDLNEYLSSIKLSGTAFKELTEYYKTVDRDVIICMVGDHAPSFITSLEAKENLLFADNTINTRAVPYVIWSNFGAKCSAYMDYASMVDLMPMVLEAGDVPMSAFYEHVLRLHNTMPIRTREGLCVNTDDQMSLYDVNDAKYELLKQYYYLEYNSLLTTDEYQEELFLP